ncbi:amino acid--tRNA ligase-related protein [Candidatus Latescibacterota bacterium]
MFSVLICWRPKGYGDIIGGGKREDDNDILKSKIINHGLDLNNFSWYLDLRKYDSVPHSGFGMGIERFVVWVCGLHHVREEIPFPKLFRKDVAAKINMNVYLFT